MPTVNWFTPNPYSIEEWISASKWPSFKRGFPFMNDAAWVKWVNELEPIFKQKWMSNDIYELIMMPKTTILIKHELLFTALLFWNIGTNTFDFKMDPMSPFTLLLKVQRPPKPLLALITTQPPLRAMRIPSQASCRLLRTSIARHFLLLIELRSTCTSSSSMCFPTSPRE